MSRIQELSLTPSRPCASGGGGERRVARGEPAVPAPASRRRGRSARGRGALGFQVALLRRRPADRRHPRLSQGRRGAAPDASASGRRRASRARLLPARRSSALLDPETLSGVSSVACATFLHDRVNGTYDDDFFAKDVRYALGLTVPCGALQFDLNGVVGPKLIARDLVATRSLRSTAGYLASRGWGRWYSNHIDLRAIKEFTPEGWTASFARIAELLALNPSVRGVAGVAWFYDPALVRVSPASGLYRTDASEERRVPGHDEDAAARHRQCPGPVARAEEAPRERRVFSGLLSRGVAAARIARVGRAAQNRSRAWRLAAPDAGRCAAKRADRSVS